MSNQPTVAELQALILQLQTQVQALENAATAAPIVQAAPTAPQAVIFADMPQTLGAEDLINYSSNKREQKKNETWKKELPKAGESKEGKKVGKFTFNWCEHHMAWTVHKPADCLLGKQHKDEQKKPYKANSATVAAAATLAINPHFTALMAAMANLDMNE
jgi:hypothetical protein